MSKTIPARVRDISIPPSKYLVLYSDTDPFNGKDDPAPRIFDTLKDVLLHIRDNNNPQMSITVIDSNFQIVCSGHGSEALIPDLDAVAGTKPEKYSETDAFFEQTNRLQDEKG